VNSELNIFLLSSFGFHSISIITRFIIMSAFFDEACHRLFDVPRIHT
jgi:hypothetical protein